MKKIASLAVILAFAQLAGAQINFDKGVDVKSAISSAKASEAVIPEARFPMVTDITRDCKKITFTAADSLTSPLVSLVSRETGQDCQNMGYPVGQICTPTFRNYRAEAQIVVTQPRELKPEQKEVFEVCLWGSFLSMKPVSTVYKYSVNQFLDVFQITPQTAVKAAAVKSAPVENCLLVMDSNYSCIYQCKDGSYVSKPNSFGPPPFPGMDMPMHGCRPSVPNTPLITIVR
ncbi:MAG: hypothetical protein NTY45_04670 [Elusimicrobia bacterium]|nr:hypothetical protein [Elusimicrobiota bacterium]